MAFFLDKCETFATHQKKVHHPEEEKEFHGFFLLSQEFSSLHPPCTPSQTYCYTKAAKNLIPADPYGYQNSPRRLFKV